MNKEFPHFNKGLNNNELFLKAPAGQHWQWRISIIFLILALLIIFIFWPFLNRNRTVFVGQNQLNANNLQSAPPINSSLDRPFSSLALNLLVLGIPGQNNDAPNLTDTIIVLNIKNELINLVSIPRDLLVKIPQTQNLAKINSLYALDKKNIDLIREKIKEISDISINHYLIVDLNFIKELINRIGGIYALVEKDIYDDKYPGPNYSYQTFKIQKGWRYLDGDTALKYIRSRHSTSDFDRIQRQQQIAKAIQNKLSSANLSWDIEKTLSLYSVFSSYIKTDLDIWELWQIWKIIKNLPNYQINEYILDTNLLISDNINLNGAAAAILRPRAGIENYSEIKAYVKKIIAD